MRLKKSALLTENHLVPLGPALAATDGELDVATRLTALVNLASNDPDAIIVSYDSEGNGVPTPTRAQELFHTFELVTTIEQLQHADGDDVHAAFSDMLRRGGSRATLGLPSDPTTLRGSFFIDLRGQQDLDCILCVIQSSALKPEMTSPGGAELRPRQGTMYVNSASVVLELDDSTVQMLGYEPSYLIGRTTVEYLHPDDHDTAVSNWIELLDEPGAVSRQLLRYRRANGEWFWAEVTHRNLLDSAGFVQRDILDVNDRISAISEARAKDQVIVGMAEVLPSGISTFDIDQQQVFCNDQWRRITGIDESMGRRDYASLVVDPPNGQVVALADAAVAETGRFDMAVTLQPADGSPQRRCRLALRRLNAPDGSPSGLVACLDDITDSWLLEQRLFQQATTDGLTGLLNREAMVTKLEETLSRAKDSQLLTAVMFIDLNDFKRVNDVLGHGVGDQLLDQIARALASTVRPGDTVARHGGDEFLVVCEDVESPEAALQVARRLLDAASGRFLIDGQQIDCGASVGVALDRGGEHSAERMIAEADLAMYEMKREGAQDVGLFEPAMFADQRVEMSRDGALRHATTDNSLVLHYQPIVDLASGETLGYEALLRWMYEGELIYPDGFIGLAERRGLITDIGKWVIDQVAKRASEDPRRNLLWTLNVSPVQLRDGSLADAVLRALARHNLDAHQLGLELTETATLARTEDVRDQLERLTQSGVSLIVDDFGTGFASLDYLRTLPVNGLKVDRCFTNDLHLDRTRAIIANVISLASALELRLVVEGVETNEQQVALAELGASVAQGYYFGRPAPYETCLEREGLPLQHAPLP